MIPPFVDLQWLTEHRDQVVLADVRFYLDGTPPRSGYDAGHIPGAVYVELEGGLAAHGSPAEGRHPLPEPAAFAAAMGATGIGDDSTVVAYDDAGGVIAARLVWMLRAIGHAAALLDGGLTAWTGETTTDPTTPEPTTFTPVPWPGDRIATIDDARDPANAVVDARPRERFEGAPDAVDPRFGHIPGARSLPVREHLVGGHLRPGDELRADFAAAGVDGTRPLVSSCGSGVTACHNLLVAEHLGLPAGRLYPGSWSQYAHTELPVETGPA